MKKIRLFNQTNELFRYQELSICTTDERHVKTFVLMRFFSNPSGLHFLERLFGQFTVVGKTLKSTTVVLFLESLSVNDLTPHVVQAPLSFFFLSSWRPFGYSGAVKPLQKELSYPIVNVFVTFSPPIWRLSRGVARGICAPVATFTSFNRLENDAPGVGAH